MVRRTSEISEAKKATGGAARVRTFDNHCLTRLRVSDDQMIVLVGFPLDHLQDRRNGEHGRLGWRESVNGADIRVGRCGDHS